MATKPMPSYSPDDLFDLPLPPGVIGFELVDGVPVEVTPVGPDHGSLAVEIALRMHTHVREHDIAGRVYGEAGYVLGLRRDPKRVRGPDVSFLSTESLQRHGGKPARGFFRCAPDLAVEIESAERPKALQQRIQDYLDAGTRLVWVIHSETTAATVYRADGSARLLRESDALDGEDVLPGLKIPLRELFEDAI
ncbi:MAG: Uma2 family endonuclease [Longimicrobiales bacterium]